MILAPSVLDVLAGRSRYTAILGDGFALAAALDDGAVDIVLGDLPYNDDTHVGARTNKKGTNGEIDINFAPLPPPETFLPALLRCSRRWVLCFCALEQLGVYQSAAHDQYVRGGIWDRTNGTPQKTGDRPAQGAEGIAILHRLSPSGARKYKWNGHGKRAVWSGPICDDPTRKHPTKKPRWLMDALLRDFAEPGDVILDPTMGEGTTGEACLGMGLSFIGCEIDPRYHALAVKRLDRAAARGVQMALPAHQPRAQQSQLFQDSPPRRPRSA